jgi:hypothetical protein
MRRTIGVETTHPKHPKLQHSAYRVDFMNIARIRSFRALIAAAVVLFATPALAATMLFGEVLTSSESLFLPQNVRATLEAGALDGDPENIILNGSVTAGDGLGSGMLGHPGDYVLFTHRFTPSLAYESVTSAHLMVGVRDDAFHTGDFRDMMRATETVDIALNGGDWAGGSAWFSLYDGDVTALFSNQEDEMVVAVIARNGTSVVDFSSVIWTYETADVAMPGTSGGGTPVPEPTGLALFCVGAIVLRGATRRRA